MGIIWVLTDERYLAQRMPAAVVDELRVRGNEVRTVVVDRVTLSSVDGRVRSPLEGLGPTDVVLARSRHPFALALLELAERTGAQVVPGWAGVALARDKARCVDVLAAHGVPVPATILAANADAVRSLDSSWFPLLLKPHLGDNARGLHLLEHPDEAGDLVWDDGLLLGQRWVEAGGWDLKLYVCADRMWAVRRRSPIAAPVPPGSGPAAAPTCGPVPEELRAIARTCRDVFDLPLCGVDVLLTAEGPRVVDVNDFPNYTGVPQAPATIADLAAARLTSDQEVDTCTR